MGFLKGGFGTVSIEIRGLALETFLRTPFGPAGPIDVDVLGKLSASHQGGRPFLQDDQKAATHGSLLIATVGKPYVESSRLESKNVRGVTRQDFERTFETGRDNESDLIAEEDLLERQNLEEKRLGAHLPWDLRPEHEIVL
jgi:hypothetical protein